jgi:hypothetical protein
MSGAKSQAEASVGFFQSFFGPRFRPAPLAASPNRALARHSDGGAVTIWTASLSRGDGLPPFRLSIRSGGAAQCSIRFDPLLPEQDADSSSLAP